MSLSNYLTDFAFDVPMYLDLGLLADLLNVTGQVSGDDATGAYETLSCLHKL